LWAAFEILQPDASDMASFGRSPRAEHKDPFDRMIVWQAIRQGFTLITKDAGLRVYQAHGLKTFW
jgi:PIN domain nuclease of toxin-antitoxin system